LPGGSIPSASVQELAERKSEEPWEELGRLAAELNYRLELQKQKTEESGCGPTGALWGPPAIRPVPRSGPTSGFYEPQVVRPTLEKEVQGSGPTDNSVLTVRNKRETPSVVRPVMEHSQMNSANGKADGAYSNGTPAISDVSGKQYPARSGQIILSPVTGQTQSNFREERKQAEGKSMSQSVVTEQPSSVPMYRLVQVTPGEETIQSCPGIPRSSTSSLKQAEERTPQLSKADLENGGSVYHTARAKCKDLRHMEEPSTEAELRTKERKTTIYE